MTTPASLWLADPAWAAMDPTARGFHAQLVLLAAQSGGQLSDDETQWRRWLGIPESGASPAMPAIPSVIVQWVNQGTPNRLAQLGGMAGLTEHYWVTRWLPMVRAAWSNCGEGKVTCKAAQMMAQMGPGQAIATNKETDAATQHTATPAPNKPKARKTTRRKTSKAKQALAILDHPLEQLTGWDGPCNEGWAWVQPMGERLFDFDQVKARWHVPANRAARLNLWTVGLAALATGPGEENKNRSFLAALIKKYGERKVSAALGQISARAVPPADPRAFLRAILRRETEGTAEAQRAREERASIPL